VNSTSVEHIIDIKADFNQQIPGLVATASVFGFFPRFVDALRVPVTSAAKNSAAGRV
jgi:hypothetical protein